MNLNELKAKAQAATPGPWVVHPNRPYSVDSIEGDGELAVYVCTTGGWADCDVPNAAFIAAANPQTVLALVKVAEAVKKVLEADNQEFYPDSPFDRAVEDAYAALEELEAME